MAIYLVNTDNRFEHDVKTSLAAGTIAAGVETVLLPHEAKRAIKDTIIGEDRFLKNKENELNKKKTIMRDIDVQKELQKAKEEYPLIRAAAGQLAKGIAGTFAFVGLSVLGFRLAEEKIFASESKKNLDKEI